MTNEEISQILVMILSIMFVILITLCVIFLMLKIKEKKQKEEIENAFNDKTGNELKKKELNKIDSTYSKQSIIDFMEFDKIEDNMIIQKKGKRFLMVVECQGVNYDLMSNTEKVGVEEGFQQFLNTLRHPVQIYIQTRTINLENSIETYKKKIKDIEDAYTQKLFEYRTMQSSGIYSKKDLDKVYFEITKQKNLLEYGKDLVANTEKMSLNKNVLNKKYYIIIPYFPEEAVDGKYIYEEVKNMAFSELYTKSQSIIRTLSSCSINGKILSSNELVELLYVAYNRDESEVFGIDKILKSGYEELYSTAPDVFEKKIKALDKEIEERAIDLANETIEKVKSKPQQIAETKQEDLEELVRRMAEIILSENKEYVGQEIADQAIEEIRKTEEEGGEEQNEEVKETTKTTRRKRATTK